MDPPAHHWFFLFWKSCPSSFYFLPLCHHFLLCNTVCSHCPPQFFFFFVAEIATIQPQYLDLPIHKILELPNLTDTLMWRSSPLQFSHWRVHGVSFLTTIGFMIVVDFLFQPFPFNFFICIQLLSVWTDDPFEYVSFTAFHISSISFVTVLRNQELGPTHILIWY